MNTSLRELGEVGRAPHGGVQLVDAPLVDRAHRDELLGEHVERVRAGSASPRSRRPACARPPRSPRAGRRGTSGRSCRGWARPPGGPARPMRCRPLATDPGDSTCTTRSTAPMSMPSSRLLVATIARRRPDFSASSTSSRCSRAIDPWCVRTRSSSASSLSWAARRSASRRPFTNTIVERCARISSSSRGWIDGQIDVRGGTRPGGRTARRHVRAADRSGPCPRSGRRPRAPSACDGPRRRS